jgi:hypothetical protein
MCTKSKTEIFIEKAKLVHGDKYGYSLVEYVDSKTKVLIICDKHFPSGFLQTPTGHLTNRGCMQCGLDKICLLSTKTTEKFIEEGNLKYNNKFDYSQVEYINAKIPVKIICPIHSEFYQVPYVHLNVNHGCPKCGNLAIRDKKILTTQEFIDKANLVHNFEYDYSQVEYVNTLTKIKIICPKCGIFEQSPLGHLKGDRCNKCYKNKQLTTNIFKERAINKHCDKYCYDNSKYTTNKVKVEIYCKKHDIIFFKNPIRHINGSGCDKCASEARSEYNISNPQGWSYSSWERVGLKSKKFDTFKVYIIKCYNDDEVFYKIGKTFYHVKNRFNSKYHLPYSYDIIKIYEGDARKICELEHILQKLNNSNIYKPKLSFGGQYECFSSITDETLDYIFN